MKRSIEGDGVAIVSGMDGDGNFGFFLKDDKRIPTLKNTWGLTNDEHMGLIDGQCDGKQIKWDEEHDYKPYLYTPPPPTEEELREMAAEKVRVERDKLLLDTDKYRIDDYPISDEEREMIREYRQWLRDLPTLEEFPDVKIPTVEEWLAANKAA